VMLDEGVGENEFSVDAVDINTKAIDKARLGVYGGNSFRGDDIVFRDRYFEPKDGLYVISEKIKSSVHFINENVLSGNFMSGKGPYDVIFCRNLLIYFDYENKCRVLKKLHRLLTSSGVLFLGHAETGRMPYDLFESLKLPGSFAYRKNDDSRAKQVPVLKALPPVRVQSEKNEIKSSSIPANLPRPEKKNQFVSEDQVVSGQKKETDNDVWIDAIQGLADEGKLKEAITECDRFIDAVPDSAQGYYLKGVVMLAFDADMEAFNAFKKAVYLDPQNYKALIQLAVLAESQGDFSVSKNYRARAERIANNGLSVAD